MSETLEIAAAYNEEKVLAIIHGEDGGFLPITYSTKDSLNPDSDRRKNMRMFPVGHPVEMKRIYALLAANAGRKVTYLKELS